MIRHEDIDDGRIWSKLHKTSCCPSLCPPCNFLWHPFRKAVSRRKRRFIKDGFDLDLVYLTPRIIIHGFPAIGLEHLYRNPRYELKRLLEFYHHGKYKVFNFCCEPGRGYSPDVFDGRVERYPFKDHNTPPLETMVAYANSAKAWLDQDPENVCSVHCKAGKGRAGLMSCVLLIRSGFVQNTQEALDHYDRERVTNNRGLTVTSQRKFVLFYERLWREHWNVQGNIGDIPGETSEVEEDTTHASKFKVPKQPTTRIYGIEIVNAPEGLLKNVRVKILKGSNFSPELKFDSGKSSFRGSDNLFFECDCVVEGNFKIGIEASKGVFGGMVKVLELWHNTLFMDCGSAYVDFPRNQLDMKRSFRKQLGPDVIVRLLLVKSESPLSGSSLHKQSVQIKGYEMVARTDLHVHGTADSNGEDGGHRI